MKKHFTCANTALSTPPCNSHRVGTILSLIFALTLGFSTNAWAYTFKSGTVIYVDMTAITTSNFGAKIFVDFGTQYYTPVVLDGSAEWTTGTNNGEFRNCNKPLLQLTFTQAANITSDKILLETSVGNWSSVKNTFPSAGQDLMTVSSDGKTVIWGTYTPSSDCPNCKTITKQ